MHITFHFLPSIRIIHIFLGVPFARITDDERGREPARCTSAACRELPRQRLPTKQRNAGGAGPGLTTYRQPTVPFKVCFAITGACFAAGELRDVPSLGLLDWVDRRRSPPPASN
eukprot:scaffold199544_cov27-Cyclotella_meneghiniana.AAC.1